jgi:hypothetical protein
MAQHVGPERGKRKVWCGGQALHRGLWHDSAPPDRKAPR